jgi:hypothetical protein
MDKPTNKMSSPATLGDESSPWQSSGTSAGEDDLVHEESMLKRKLAVIEEFMENGESHSFEMVSVIPLRGDETASLNQAYESLTSPIPVTMGR